MGVKNKKILFMSTFFLFLVVMFLVSVEEAEAWSGAVTCEKNGDDETDKPKYFGECTVLRPNEFGNCGSGTVLNVWPCTIDRRGNRFRDRAVESTHPVGRRCGGSSDGGVHYTLIVPNQPADIQNCNANRSNVAGVIGGFYERSAGEYSGMEILIPEDIPSGWTAKQDLQIKARYNCRGIRDEKESNQCYEPDNNISNVYCKSKPDGTPVAWSQWVSDQKDPGGNYQSCCGDDGPNENWISENGIFECIDGVATDPDDIATSFDNDDPEIYCDYLNYDPFSAEEEDEYGNTPNNYISTLPFGSRCCGDDIDDEGVIVSDTMTTDKWLCYKDPLTNSFSWRDAGYQQNAFKITTAGYNLDFEEQFFVDDVFSPWKEVIGSKVGYFDQATDKVYSGINSLIVANYGNLNGSKMVLMSKSIELDPTTNKINITGWIYDQLDYGTIYIGLVADDDLALTSRGADTLEGAYKANDYALDGNHDSETDYEQIGATSTAPGDIVFGLEESHIVRIKTHLFDKDSPMREYYGYQIFTSESDVENTQNLFLDKLNLAPENYVKGIQDDFAPEANTSFITIRGKSSTAGNGFHIIELEAYSGCTVTPTIKDDWQKVECEADISPGFTTSAQIFIMVEGPWKGSAWVDDIRIEGISSVRDIISNGEQWFTCDASDYPLLSAPIPSAPLDGGIIGGLGSSEWFADVPSEDLGGVALQLNPVTDGSDSNIVPWNSIFEGARLITSVFEFGLNGEGCIGPFNTTLGLYDCDNDGYCAATTPLATGNQDVISELEKPENADLLAQALTKLSDICPSTIQSTGGIGGFQGIIQSTMDCDDSLPSVYPGAREVCDEVDNDCDKDDPDNDVWDNDKTTGVDEACSTLFTENQVGSIEDIELFDKAARFYCYNEDGRSEFAECVGFNLDLAASTDPTKVRRQGALIHTIKEFPCIDSSFTNCALMLGWGTRQQFIDLDRDTQIYQLYTDEESSEQKNTASQTIIRDWSSFDSFDFFIAYLGNFVLNIEIKDAKGSIVLPKTLISNYLVTNPATKKWLHVSIPISEMDEDYTSDVREIKLSVDKTQVMENVVVESDLFPTQQFGNIIAIDKLALMSPDQMYCSGAWPKKGSLENLWISDLDDPTSDSGGIAVGSSACEDIPSYGWTGTACCGDDQGRTVNSETFSDSENGCWEGDFVRNNTIVGVNLYE